MRTLAPPWDNRSAAPIVPVFFGKDVVVGSQVPLEGFELLAVLKANDVFRRHGFLTEIAGFNSAFGGSMPCTEALLNAA